MHATLRRIATILAAVLCLWALATPSLAAGKPDFLVDAEWLEERLNDPKLVLLEVRYHPHRYFTIGHIPGAIQVKRFMDLGDNHGVPMMRFPPREQFQATLRRWGVNDDSLIVIYDDSGTPLAARLYYLLELYGFDMKRVKILNGGLTGWRAFNELTREEPKIKPGAVTLKPADPSMFVEWTYVYDKVVARRQKDVVLIDSRPAFGYTGERLTHAVRGGHIPGAINIVSLDGVDAETKEWKPLPEIAKMYASVPKDKDVVLYCHDGFRMSLGWLQMKALGYKRIRLYNGGWDHWGNRLSLPVVKGDKPLDDETK
ncbi:MAG TPA: sulfurtransferase [Thermopetrobacter sp.]|nr:sulfurtransferase [Thermopetrobacter sp.]